jgi:hypothetical protein
MKKQAIPYAEDRFVPAFDRFADLTGQLGVEPSYYWTAGMEDLKDRPPYYPVADPVKEYFPSSGVGCCVPDVVMAEGVHLPGAMAVTSLEPFFEKFFDKCGVFSVDINGVLIRGTLLYAPQTQSDRDRLGRGGQWRDAARRHAIPAFLKSRG